MFVLQAEPQWTWPVIVRIPNQAGAFDTAEFRATFRLLPKPERDALGETEAGTDDLLRRCLVGVSGIEVEGGVALPAIEGWRDVLIGLPWVRSGLIAAYAESLAGVPSRAAAGN